MCDQMFPLAREAYGGHLYLLRKADTPLSHRQEISQIKMGESQQGEGAGALAGVTPLPHLRLYWRPSREPVV